MNKYIFFIFFKFIYTQINFNSFIEQDSIYIGDIVNYIIQVEIPDAKIPIFPELNINSDDFNIINHTVGDNYIIYHLSFWKSGFTTIPPIPIQFKENNEIVITMETDSLQVYVLSLLKNQESTIRNIKGMFDIKLQSTIEKYLKIILIMLGIIGLIYFWRKRHIKVNKNKRKRYIELEHVNIIKNIENLKIPVPLNFETSESYYLDLTYQFRKFLECNYYLKSFEMTTSEIENYFNNMALIDTKSKDEIIKLLTRADLSKFAMYVPSRKQLFSDTEVAVKLIRELVLK